MTVAKKKSHARRHASVVPPLPPAKIDRRPYAHAADMREALLELHAVIADGDGRDALLRLAFDPKLGDVTHLSPSPLMITSWEITDYAERLRAAAKRVLVAKVGLRRARRYDGWRRGQWSGSPTYQGPEAATEKARKAVRS